MRLIDNETHESDMIQVLSICHMQITISWYVDTLYSLRQKWRQLAFLLVSFKCSDRI